MLRRSCLRATQYRLYSDKVKQPLKKLVADNQEEKQVKPLTQLEKDQVLMEAYKEKLGGDANAQFEDGKPSEMNRAVKNNLFRYI